MDGEQQGQPPNPGVNGAYPQQPGIPQNAVPPFMAYMNPAQMQYMQNPMMSLDPRTQVMMPRTNVVPAMRVPQQQYQRQFTMPEMQQMHMQQMQRNVMMQQNQAQMMHGGAIHMSVPMQSGINPSYINAPSPMQRPAATGYVLTPNMQYAQNTLVPAPYKFISSTGQPKQASAAAPPARTSSRPKTPAKSKSTVTPTKATSKVSSKKRPKHKNDDGSATDSQDEDEDIKIDGNDNSQGDDAARKIALGLRHKPKQVKINSKEDVEVEFNVDGDDDVKKEYTMRERASRRKYEEYEEKDDEFDESEVIPNKKYKSEATTPAIDTDGMEIFESNDEKWIEKLYNHRLKSKFRTSIAMSKSMKTFDVLQSTEDHADDASHEPLTMENVDRFEFLVKYRGKSHIHCEWREGEAVRTQPHSRQRLLRYVTIGNPEVTDDGEPFNPDYTEVDRIIDDAMRWDEQEVDGRLDWVEKEVFLVKWMSLGYSEATWEVKKDVPNIEEELIRYHARNKPPVLQVVPSRPNVCSEKEFQDKHAVKPDTMYKGGRSLRSYQVEGVNWLIFNWLNNRSSLLADEMGLGKTIQSIGFVTWLHKTRGVRGPYLIVVPLSTLANWDREFRSWTDMNVVIYHGAADARQVIIDREFYYDDDPVHRPGTPIGPAPGTKVDETGSKMLVRIPRHRENTLYKFDVIITTYEMVVRETYVFEQVPWEVMIIDEAHRLKNRHSASFEQLSRLRVRDRVLLTGTPLQNNTEELYNLLHFLQPRTFLNKEGFMREFGELTDSSQVEALHLVLKPYLLRRMKEDVEKAILAKDETIIEVWKKNVRVLLRGVKQSNLPSLNNVMMELRKCCNHPFLVSGVEEELGVHNMKQITEMLVRASGKMVLLDKLLPRLKDTGHQVLIFSQFTRVLDLLEDYLHIKGYKYERMDGRVKGEARQAAIDRFCSPTSDRFVFLITTRAGGLGINLTAADTVIIFDSDWNPQNDIQAMARCHRIGQTKAVKVYRLITRNTYEREMFDRASKKLGLDQAVFHAMNSQDEDVNGDLKHAQSSGNLGGGWLDKEEINSLLKHGAYGLMNKNDDAEADRFFEEDIDSILQRRTQIINTTERGKSATALNKFSKASFVTKGDETAKDADKLDLQDPELWERLFPGISFERDERILDTVRNRTQVKRFGEEIGEVEIEQFLGVRRRTPSGVKNRGHWNHTAITEVRNGLWKYGYWRWSDIHKDILSHRKVRPAGGPGRTPLDPPTEDEIHVCARVYVLYALLSSLNRAVNKGQFNYEQEKRVIERKSETKKEKKDDEVMENYKNLIIPKESLSEIEVDLRVLRSYASDIGFLTENNELDEIIKFATTDLENPILAFFGVPKMKTFFRAGGPRMLDTLEWLFGVRSAVSKVVDLKIRHVSDDEFIASFLTAPLPSGVTIPHNASLPEGWTETHDRSLLLGSFLHGNPLKDRKRFTDMYYDLRLPFNMKFYFTLDEETANNTGEEQDPAEPENEDADVDMDEAAESTPVTPGPGGESHPTPKPAASPARPVPTADITPEERKLLESVTCVPEKVVARRLREVINAFNSESRKKIKAVTNKTDSRTWNKTEKKAFVSAVLSVGIPLCVDQQFETQVNEVEENCKQYRTDTFKTYWTSICDTIPRDEPKVDYAALAEPVNEESSYEKSVSLSEVEDEDEEAHRRRTRAKLYDEKETKHRHKREHNLLDALVSEHIEPNKFQPSHPIFKIDILLANSKLADKSSDMLLDYYTSLVSLAQSLVKEKGISVVEPVKSSRSQRENTVIAPDDPDLLMPLTDLLAPPRCPTFKRQLEYEALVERYHVDFPDSFNDAQHVSQAIETVVKNNLVPDVKPIQDISPSDTYAAGDLPELTEKDARRLLQQVVFVRRLWTDVLSLSNDALVSRLKYAPAGRMPVWWNNEIHDIALLQGIKKHGFGRWKSIVDDPELPFAGNTGDLNEEEEDKEKTEEKQGFNTASLQRRAEKLYEYLSRMIDAPMLLIKMPVDEQLPAVTHYIQGQINEGNFIDFSMIDDIYSIALHGDSSIRRKSRGGVNTGIKVTSVTRFHKEQIPVSTKEKIARDELGNVLYPILLRENGVKITSLGHIDARYHAKRYIWPVGFKSTVVYNRYVSPCDDIIMNSMKDHTKRITYSNEILEGNEKDPIFRVVPEDDPTNVIEDSTATGAWNKVVKAVDMLKPKTQQRTTIAISGPRMFGFSVPAIARLIQELPDADKCVNYEPVQYVDE